MKTYIRKGIHHSDKVDIVQKRNTLFRKEICPSEQAYIIQKGTDIRKCRYHSEKVIIIQKREISFRKGMHH